MTGPGDTAWCELTLFVNGASQLSAGAITDATAVCETHLDGRYSLSIVDLNDDSEPILSSEVRLSPSLVKNLPLPVRMVVGDLSNTDRVALALELPADRAAPVPGATVASHGGTRHASSTG